MPQPGLMPPPKGLPVTLHARLVFGTDGGAQEETLAGLTHPQLIEMLDSFRPYIRRLFRKYAQVLAPSVCVSPCHRFCGQC